jgi:hypothetical protein
MGARGMATEAKEFAFRTPFKVHREYAPDILHLAPRTLQR